ncbi:hypothetical protein Gorai_021483 [Gossypium raimondii]|uniref:Uncharacterized protein n=1 Tax=Gossypium raimondii TaxID=29730 RepID=A0A7J8NQU2_GOSRA|nr:hypothetical protein [Gossypium raimondii]
MLKIRFLLIKSRCLWCLKPALNWAYISL